MKKHFLLAAATSIAFALTACGGGDDPALVTTKDATVAINPTTGATITSALRGETFAFPGGVPALGTTGATSLTFTQPPAGTTTPTFSVTDTTGSASGTVGFGSCIFVVQSSTIAKMPVGTKIEVEPCSLTVDTSGTAANGTAQELGINLTLGATISTPTTATVSVSPTGAVTVNSVVATTVTVTPATGT